MVQIDNQQASRPSVQSETTVETKVSALNELKSPEYETFQDKQVRDTHARNVIKSIEDFKRLQSRYPNSAAVKRMGENLQATIKRFPRSHNAAKLYLQEAGHKDDAMSSIVNNIDSLSDPGVSYTKDISGDKYKLSNTKSDLSSLNRLENRFYRWSERQGGKAGSGFKQEFSTFRGEMKAHIGRIEPSVSSALQSAIRENKTSDGKQWLNTSLQRSLLDESRSESVVEQNPKSTQEKRAPNSYTFSASRSFLTPEDALSNVTPDMTRSGLTESRDEQVYSFSRVERPLGPTSLQDRIKSLQQAIRPEKRGRFSVLQPGLRTEVSSPQPQASGARAEAKLNDPLPQRGTIYSQEDLEKLATEPRLLAKGASAETKPGDQMQLHRMEASKEAVEKFLAANRKDR